MWLKGNNKGRGFWFEYSDGFSGWVLGLSKQELKQEELKHGKLVRYFPA